MRFPFLVYSASGFYFLEFYIVSKSAIAQPRRQWDSLQSVAVIRSFFESLP